MLEDTTKVRVKRGQECMVSISTPGYELYVSDTPTQNGDRIGYTPVTFKCPAIEKGPGLYECKRYVTLYKLKETEPVTDMRITCIDRAIIVFFKYGNGDWELDEVQSSPEVSKFGRRTTSPTGVSIPIDYCITEEQPNRVQITATSPIPMCFSDDCEGGQRIPCSSNCVWMQSVSICDGRHTELACWDGDSTIGFITPIDSEGVITKELSECCASYDNRYKGTVALDPFNGTMHITIREYPPLPEMPDTMRVTADSSVALWVGDESGIAPIPCTRDNAMRWGMSFHIAVTDDIDRDDSGIFYPHVDYAEGVTMPFNTTLRSSKTPQGLRGTYEGTAFIEGALGTVHINLEKFTPMPRLSPPTYEFEDIRTNFAYVHMTCCIRECGEICGTHIPSPSDEYDECEYQIEVSEDGISWRDTGQDIEELTPGTRYTVRARTVDEPAHRCDASEWVVKTFTTLPLESSITVDLAASIAAGGIPEEIWIGQDAAFTFIVKNLGAKDEVVDVFLTFENHDLPRIYPHDLTGLAPSGAAYILPGSDIYIIDDSYAASYPITIKAGESKGYTLTVQLPHDAIPIGVDSIEYGIFLKVATYM